MAITKQATTLHGFSAPSAYYRVEELKLDDKSNMSFVLQVYKSQDESTYAFNSYSYSCSYDLNGSNPIAQAYEYVKTLSEFSDATDV